MSDYTKLTNFAVKDGYITGNPAKVIKGTEFDDEFNAISTAISTKYDSSDVIPITNGGTGATTVSAARAALSAAQSGANSDITSLSGLTTALSIAQGGTGATTDSGARTALGLGSLATLSAVGTAQITDANITASKLSGAQSGSAPVFGIRAWVAFDGSGSTGTNMTLHGSGNITSVYKNGSGDYTVTFATALPNANYATVGTCMSTGGANSAIVTEKSAAGVSPSNKTASAVDVSVKSGTDNSSAYNSTYVYLMFIG